MLVTPPRFAYELHRLRFWAPTRFHPPLPTPTELARLDLAREEEETLAGNFGRILEHFRVLEGLDPAKAQLFFGLYFVMTGLHGLHMILGILVVLYFAIQAWRSMYPPENYVPVEMVGLYWHFVDIIWVFLFPLLYLIGLH